MSLQEINVADMNELEIKSILHSVVQNEHNRETLLRYYYAFIHTEIEDGNDFEEQNTLKQTVEMP